MNIASSPEQSPLRWAVINAACFLASVAVFVDVLVAETDVSERPAARASYLIWNFGTTIVWLFEVATIIHYRYPALKWEHCVEILLAVYFTVDSIHLIYMWQIKKQDVEEELWDVAINAVVYAIVLERVVSICKRKSDSIQHGENASDENTLLV